MLGGLAPELLRAQSTLLFLELQAIGAYSTAAAGFQLFSLMPDDAMQKPSLGFDLVRRFSGRTGDIGVLAVQARLAYDQEGEHKLEPQLYNAYFRLKTKVAGIWIGHNRPALGSLPSSTVTPSSCRPRPCSDTASTGTGGSGSSGISVGGAPPPR